MAEQDGAVLSVELLDEALRILKEPGHQHPELLPPYDPYGTWPLAFGLVLQSSPTTRELMETKKEEL